VAALVSTVEEFMPAFQQPLLLLLYEFQDPIDFFSGEPETAFQQDRIEPNFRLVVFAFHMDMGRLIPVTRIEEKPVGSRSQYGGHPPMLQAQMKQGYRDGLAFGLFAFCVLTVAIVRLCYC
jgi:hypothetical protein